MTQAQSIANNRTAIKPWAALNSCANNQGKEKSSRPDGRSVLARVRRDLIVVPVRHRHEIAYVVKDPIAMKYLRLREDEFFLLSLLNNECTLESMVADYAKRFAPRTIKSSDVNDLLFRLHKNGLLISESTGQAESLEKRAAEKQRQKLQQLLLSPLFIRFPGIDPDRFLSRTIRYVRPLMSPALLLGMAFMCVVAAVQAGVRWSQFWVETNDMDRWFRLESILMLGMVIGGVKVLHELGHAYVCKRFGGECHTIGPMLMFFSPALYCDTTDSWLLPNRFERAAVGAAGIAVELVLAALATFVWTSTADGLVHYAAMNVMLVCSVQTLFFNANPLMRYDGYYVLSDLWDVPNLASRSQRMLQDWVANVFGWRTAVSHNESAGFRLAMIGYAMAALVYRWTLTFTILLLLSRILRPVGLESIGLTACFLMLVMMMIRGISPLAKTLSSPIHRRALRPRRVLIALSATLVALSACTIPLSSRVGSLATITPRNATPIYVAAAGFVEQTVAPGDLVKPGDVMARLRNPAIELDYVSAKAKVTNQRRLIESLRQAEIRDASMSQRIPAAEAMLKELQDQLTMHQARVDALTIVAPRAGVIVAVEPKVSQRRDDETLEDWTGLPTEIRNRGCFLGIGTEICRIADAGGFDAEAIVPQSVATQVHEDANVRLATLSSPGQPIRGRVAEVSRRHMDLRKGETDSTDATSAASADKHALDVAYLVRIELDPLPPDIVTGQQADALIEGAPMSVAKRVWLSLTGLLRLRT